MIKEISISFNRDFWVVKYYKHNYKTEIYMFPTDKKQYRFIAEFADKIMKEKVKIDKCKSE